MNNTAIPTGTTAVGSENPVVPSGDAGIPLNAAAVTSEPTTAVPFTETGVVAKPNTAQSEQTMLSDQFNFVNTQNSSDPSKQIAPKDQKTTAPTKPTKQQLLEAEIDKAFNEVFETDRRQPPRRRIR